MTHQLEELREALQDPIRDLSIQLTASMFVTGNVPEKLYEYEKELEDKIIQLIAQHDTELLNDVQESLLSYRGAYIAAGGKRVDNMVHHSVIKEVIEQYQHKLGEKDGDNT